jgi:hypothetical protein
MLSVNVFISLQPYYQRAALDKEQYDREMREYNSQIAEHIGATVEVPRPVPRRHNKENIRNSADSTSSSSSAADSSSSSEEKAKKRRASFRPRK